MLLDMGHEVYLYGAENSTAPCTKLIVTHTLKDIRDTWGEGDNRFEVGYNWHDKQFKHDFNAKRELPTMKFYSKAIQEINKVKKPDDFLIITQGAYQKPVDEGVGLYLTIETGIGYRGSYTKFRAFESSYIQNFTYGSQHPFQSINGNFYDRVIPNYFDEKDFPFVDKKEDYFLFMGRMIQRKGVHIAIKTVDAIGAKLKLAGQLSNEISLDQLSENCEYVGYADAKKRAELMGKAKAVFCPSTYLEPFCGVHAEAMLCGTPVITTNFGAFTDYVIDGVNGYKCNTLNDLCYAAMKVGTLNPTTIRKTAERFTLHSVQKEYQRWFDDLHQLYLSTTDPQIKGWHYINWEEQV
jgi:glycosyltransferase involved in cell wall biosynthesis